MRERKQKKMKTVWGGKQRDKSKGLRESGENIVKVGKKKVERKIVKKEIRKEGKKQEDKKMGKRHRWTDSKKLKKRTVKNRNKIKSTESTKKKEIEIKKEEA